MACGVAAIAQPTASDVWINEFHYDGVTTFNQSDQSEFVEIVVKKTLYDNATEFAKLKLVLYSSGAIDQTGLLDGRGLPYNEASILFTVAETEHLLTSFQACATTSNEYMILSKAMSNLQDLPSGFAIVYNSTSVVQLLSYEKVFKVAPSSAGGGIAAGLTTTVILEINGDTATENSLSLNTHSVSLIGTGVSYNNFNWTDEITQSATPCAVNAGQTLSSGAPLPVRWLNFQATGNGSSIYTEWIVADDKNTTTYEVELKGVAYNSFTKLAAVAKQTSVDKYNEILKNLPAGTYFVRIKAIENNGGYYYSSERMVRLGKGISSLTIYPNPVRSNYALLQFVAVENSSYAIHIIDATGRIIKQQFLGTIKNNQLNTFNLDLNGVLPGTYTIKLKGSVEEMNKRIVVVK